MKYYFIHGAGDIAATDARANTLEGLIPGLLRLSYWTDLPYTTNWQSLLQQTSTTDNNTVFIGESFGGFWAAQLALEKHACCYLLNPAMSPADQLMQFVGQTLQTGRSSLTAEAVQSNAYAPDPRSPIMQGRIGLMLGHNDTLITPNTTLNFLKDFVTPDWINDGHSIELQSSFSIIVQKVKSFKDEGKLGHLARKLKSLSKVAEKIMG